MADNTSEIFDPKPKSGDLSAAIELTDDFILKNWPALYIAYKFHKLGPGPIDVMDFIRYPFQVAPLKDNSQIQVYMKCVQVGITETATIKCFARALLDGWNLIYSFPTNQLKNDMVKQRIDKSIAATPYYRQAIKDSPNPSDNLGLKVFPRGSIRYVASESKVAFLSYAADAFVADEVDKSDIVNLAMAPDRLQASPHKHQLWIGNPSFPKFGIHEKFLESDQKEWNVKCSHCDTWQPLEFFGGVVREVTENAYELIDREWNENLGRDIFVHCKKCGQPLDRFSEGRWIAEKPQSKISGYHFSQMFSPTVTIAEIYKDFVAALTDLNKMQLFFNSRLGLPYSAIGQSLSETLLDDKCLRDYLMPSVAKGCTMGVDVNVKIKVRIDDHPEKGIRRAVYIGSVTSFGELDTLIRKYDVRFCVVDILPETREVEKLQDRFPGIVWACDYPQTDPLVTFAINEEERLIRANRTASLDDMVSEILQGHNYLPKNWKGLDSGDYLKQMEAPKRHLDRESVKLRYVWDEEGKRDDWFHTENYANLASKLLDLFGLITIKSGGERPIRKVLSSQSLKSDDNWKGYA